jgi:hypothetical protein
MKTLKILATILLAIYGSSLSFSQTTGSNSFKSAKYGYSINIPSGFSQATATGRNIDLKLVMADGTNILINVTPRRPEEYNITAHDYSREMFEKEFSQSTPTITISKSEKTYISGEKAFLINYTNPSNSTKALEIYTFKGNYAYVFTATSKVSQFPIYEPIFLKTFNSFKF